MMSAVPALANEATIDQVRGTIRATISQINAAALSTPVKPQAALSQPIGNPPDIGPGIGNYAYTYQQGNNNLAAVSQAGRGNVSQLYQVGNNNTAIVTQTRR